MAKMTAKAYVQKDVIGPFLRDMIKKTSGGRRIYGSISVAPGHDYWWFLEYGTGGYHEPPDGELNPPRAVAGKLAEGPYVIQVKHKRVKNLVYWSRGQRRRAKAVIHPGIKPVAFVRTSLFMNRLELQSELKRMLERRSRTRRPFPTRDELVELVNESIQALHTRLVIATPDDTDTDIYHEDRPHDPPLHQAWQVHLAE